jgi:hypothetical protein
MSIVRVTLTHIRVPLVEPSRISNGVVAEKGGILVTIAADGIVRLVAAPLLSAGGNGAPPQDLAVIDEGHDT